MKEFVTILHETPGANNDLSPADIQAAMEQYMAWTQELRKDNRIVSEKSLSHASGVRIQGSGPDITATDGPYSEGAELVGGLHIIRAESLEEATEWAKKCPALAGGAWIELRPVEEWG